MKTHQFTLVLKNVSENTPHLEDAFYETGCDDALINFRNNAVFLDFERPGHTFEETIISTIKQVESASVNAIVASVAPEDLVTMSEAASRLNKSRQALFLWISEARRRSTTLPFPQPAMKLSDRSPLWKWKEITEWLYFHNIVTERELVDRAAFIENLNAALDERDQRIRKVRAAILRKLN